MLLYAGVAVQVAPAPVKNIDHVNTAPFFAGISDAASFRGATDARLAEVQQRVDRLLAVKGPRTVENTLRPYDDIQIALDDVLGPAIVLVAVHPDEAMRQAASDASRRARAMAEDLGLNRALYDALAAVDVSRADAPTKYYVQRELHDFHSRGVDRDQPTRERIKQLRSDLAAAQQEFLANIRANTRKITFASAADLEGLPADFIARHKPDASGAIVITTGDSDVRPVLTFAKNGDVRKRLYMEWTNIAYPANVEVLNRILALRADLAHRLGFENWAAYDMSESMAGSVKAVSDFIESVAAASAPKTARENDELLTRKRQDEPGATVINAWESVYYTELIRREHYDFDTRLLRPYLPYERVRQGVFDVASRLFGVSYRPAKDAVVWHPAVEAYDMLQDGKPIGRFYLDTHPRPNKQNSGAITYDVRAGVAGHRLPEVVLVASLPGGQPGDPGLLSHNEAVTFFHEFGHLVHAFVSRNVKYFGLRNPPEREFGEVSSQMLEEWMWDPATLAIFAKHYETNEPIPQMLVKQMQRASEFGKAIGPTGVRQQMYVARLMLSLHDRDPKSVDSTALLRESMQKYLPFPYVEGTHRQMVITHFANSGYASAYYLYMWSLVIAKDLFNQFDQNDLLAPGVARRFRDKVLAPGGSKPAAALVQDFLGRPFNAKAWEAWLNRDPSETVHPSAAPLR